MEKYVIAEDSTSEPYPIMTKMGKYYKKVYEKHLNSYAEFGANNIRDNITSTFNVALRQICNNSISNNMLLVGKVQSGKTSNLELFTALAFDNGFNLVVIYGGYDNTLLSQTMTRFKKTFDIPSEPSFANNNPVVFSSDDSAQLLSVDNEMIDELLDANKPIFIISMKRPVAMRKVNDLLSRIDKTELRAFIIDDEGDQASLNTKKNKSTDASATYQEIVNMKNHLNDPLYLSVTATPQALIFLDEYSRLRPDNIRLIEPGDGYCGVERYHLFDSDAIEIVSDEEQQELSEGRFPYTLKLAIKHYIISSAIMFKRKIHTSEMIIHSHRNVSDHDIIYSMVDAYLQLLKNSVDFNDEETKEILKIEFAEAYTHLFSEEIQSNYDFDEVWKIVCDKIIKKVYLILKNSAGQVTQANEGLRRYKIYIGGDLLQRGVTFDKLVTTYFLRWAKDGGNMDTNLQRARWLGYRAQWIDLCKIFTSEAIAREFTNLSEIETDLWEQFNAIQNGEMKIDDILIRADNTKQKPTRKNVATYNAVTFKNMWIKQRVGIFDKNQIAANNQMVEDIINSQEAFLTTAGRVDGKVSAKYTIVNENDLAILIDHIQTIFDLEPFERRPLKDLIKNSGDIPVIMMNDNDGKGRKRSFYSNNKIFALQQGADNKDKSKALYLGDSYVIVDKSKVNIQIHKIVPKKKNAAGKEIEFQDCTQYMFAIYVPKEKKYFVKG
ncbi:MAG: hypothetical protein IJT36_02135 [Alphaproteobacteria bacterium]|nr:hypothetical protein [Alphaproteobacteria bacterium]